MKTLSIKNPWAHLICWGIKDIENRSWQTKYRGKILIHTPIKYDERFRQMSNMFTPEQFDALSGSRKDMVIGGSPKNMPCSAIIGMCEIIDVVRDSKSIWAEEGCFHWVLRNGFIFDNPILNVKGKLSLWEYK